MNQFLERVAADIQARRLFSARQKILVAVSGGVDSMVLLQVLHFLAEENHWQLSVAHFNHQLRGRASDADEKLVRQNAKKMCLKFYGGSADVKSFAGRAKISIEMAARKLRHEFLARVAKEQKISSVALAHHADDQVEHFFLRLLRGAGGTGLAGMKWSSPSPADNTIALIRPLLGSGKSEILAFARRNKITFRDDATNFSSDMLRNRIRNELLPLLQRKYQPGLGKIILRVMEITGAEADFVGETADLWREATSGKKRLSAPDDFVKLPVAVQRQVLQRELTASGVVPDFELIEQLRPAAETFVSVGPDLSVARDRTGMIEMREVRNRSFNGASQTVKLKSRAGQAEFADVRFAWALRKHDGLLIRQTTALPAEYFDADRVGDEIVLRHWQPGDRFQPIGLPQAAKLQDLFVNAKIPAARRRQLVLAATAAGEIFWVPGLRIGENFKLTSRTRRQLVWTALS